MNTWIVVSDASRARIFAVGDDERAWSLVRELEHPESRVKETDLVDGERGRTRQSAGAGARSSMEPTTSPKRVEHNVFAQDLAELLEHGYDTQQYRDLVLVAPPQFLGILRGAIGAKLEKHVVAALDKDYTGSDALELQTRLDSLLKQTK